MPIRNLCFETTENLAFISVRYYPISPNNEDRPNYRMLNSSANSNILSVTKLNRLARTILESEIGQVWVSAEISNLVMASSGHWYFTLKDNRAQIRAAMFKGANRFVVKKPVEGDKVLIRASISIYEARGDYQLIVEHLEPEGEGRLKQQFEQLKQKLTADGLFAQETKQKLPDNINTVGIVTSPTGAAVQDIITVLARRNPAIKVVIYPTMVQGERAAEDIIRSIEKANTRREVDVLIVGRGGGSLEDLWCFNDERLAHVIFNSEIPTVSAVGHEIDFSITDLVADVRAPTPSAAAELVSIDQNQLMHSVNQLRQNLIKSVVQRLKNLRYQHDVRLSQLTQHHPSKRLQQQYQALDHLNLKLKHALSQKINREKTKLASLIAGIERQAPNQTIKTLQQRLDHMKSSLFSHMNARLTSANSRMATQAQLLNTVSPLATLSRGYSISFSDDKIVRTKNDVKEGDVLVTKFSDGDVKSKVIPH